MANAKYAKSQSVASSCKLEFSRFLLSIQDPLKGNMLGNPSDTFKTPSIEHYRHLPDIFRHLSDTLKHIPDIPHTSPRHTRLREEYKS